jgi:cobalt-zinc-cadmium efflux system outer membrane protein
MNPRISHFVFGIVILILGSGLGAQTETPASVSVDTLVSEVLASHPETQFYEAELAAAHGELRGAGTLASPELSVDVGRKRVSDSIKREGAAWAVSVQQTFEWPGRVSLRKAIANQQIKLAEIGVAQFKAALAARTRALALKLFAAQEEAAATREVASRFQALREVLVQRDQSGLTPELELRIIESTELTVQRRTSEAEIAERSARIELNQLRGAPSDQPLRVMPPALVFPAAPSHDALIAAALAGNFELQARRAELEQQGFRVSLARTARTPSFSVGPYVAQERAGDRETQIGIEATLPLPIWNRRSGDVAVAEARQRQAETLLLVVRRELEREIAQQAARYEAKLAEMAKWRADAVTQFKDAAALADRHYRLGAVPIATYVELQKQYLEAVGALLATRHEAVEAGLELQRLTGLNLTPQSAAGNK